MTGQKLCPIWEMIDDASALHRAYNAIGGPHRAPRDPVSAVWNCVRPLTGSGSSQHAASARICDTQRMGRYIILGMRSASSNPVSTRTDRTEFNAARSVRNRRIFVRRPNVSTIQMSRPNGGWTRCVGPASGFVTITVLWERAGSSLATIAHICFGNVTST